MAVLAAEAGISHTEYQLMDDHEVSIQIIGYRRRMNQFMRISRQNAFWNALPHFGIKVNSPKEFGILPDEVEDEKNEKPKGQSLEELASMWGD